MRDDRKTSLPTVWERRACPSDDWHFWHPMYEARSATLCFGPILQRGIHGYLRYSTVLQNRSVPMHPSLKQTRKEGIDIGPDSATALRHTSTAAAAGGGPRAAPLPAASCLSTCRASGT